MIITISREFGSGGKYIGQQLRDKLGIRFYDKEILTEALRETKMEGNSADDMDEVSHESYYDGATIFTRHFKGMALDDKIYQAEKTFIENLANGDDCIVIGRCANYILKESDTLDIFIFASDDDFKIKRKAELEDIDLKTARKRIEEIDRKRAIYHQYHTGETWGDKVNYDLCIDSSKTGVDTAVELIAYYYRVKKEER